MLLLICDPIFRHANYTFDFYHVGEKLQPNHTNYYDSSNYRFIPYVPIKKSKEKISFLGNSFSAGSEVAYEGSFVGIVDSKTKSIVRNFGVSSNNPLLYLLQWRNQIKYFNPIKGLVFTFT